MPGEDSSKPRCFLSLPLDSGWHKGSVSEAITKGIEAAGLQPVSFDETARRLVFRPAIAGELARADCFVADVSGRDPIVFFDLGLAQAMGKPSLLLIEQGHKRIEFGVRGFRHILYSATTTSLSELTNAISSSLRDYRLWPRTRMVGETKLPTPPSIDWDSLSHTDAENLCRELLLQMGYQRVDWITRSPEFDLVAELPRKDPDGFEYKEIWLVATGRNAPPEVVLNTLSSDPNFLLRLSLERVEQLDRLVAHASGEIPVTILIILSQAGHVIGDTDALRMRIEQRMKRGRLLHSLLAFACGIEAT